MKILITGSTGLLGQALTGRLARLGEVVGLSRHQLVGDGPRHLVCDLLDRAGTVATITGLRPDMVIHAQALSDVDRCELEPRAAQAQNVQTTEHLLEALEPLGAWMVFVSTDYVFDGTKGSPYRESDPTNPTTVYGRSKLEGERRVLASPRGLVLRPSTLFGRGRANFCDTVAQRVRDGQPVEAFVDQTTSPTYTEDFADMTAALVEALRAGVELPARRVFHLTNTGACSRVEFASRIVDLLGASRESIRAIRMAEQRRAAPRPAYTALKTAELPNLLGRGIRSWDDALHAYLRERRWVN